LFVDDSLVNEFTLNNFSYTETRYVNACIDYSKFIKEKRYVQYFAALPGNKLNIFTPTATNGVIILTDTLVHKAHIEVEDAYGNNVAIRFNLQFNGAIGSPPYQPKGQVLLPNRENIVTGNNTKVIFGKNAFYDAVPFVLNEISNANKNSASIIGA